MLSEPHVISQLTYIRCSSSPLLGGSSVTKSMDT